MGFLTSIYGKSSYIIKGMSVDLIVDSTRKQSSKFIVDSQTDLTLGIDLKVDSLRVEYEYFNKSIGSQVDYVLQVDF
jgi:hypothetical protein